eukprot:1158168-Pelagomonas_calceolata.AAC.2
MRQTLIQSRPCAFATYLVHWTAAGAPRRLLARDPLEAAAVRASRGMAPEEGPPAMYMPDWSVAMPGRSMSACVRGTEVLR